MACFRPSEPILLWSAGSPPSLHSPGSTVNPHYTEAGYLKMLAKLKTFHVVEYTPISTMHFVVTYFESSPVPTSDISKSHLRKLKKKKRTSQKRKWGTRHNHMGLPCTWCSLSTYHNWPVDNKNSSNSPKQVQETHYIKKFAIYKCIFHFPRYYISLTRSPKTRNDRVLLYSRQSYFVKAAVL